MPSPSDMAARRADQSAYACVPRHLVEEYQRIKRSGNDTCTSLAEAFQHSDELRAVATEIAEAALDDIA